MQLLYYFICLLFFCMNTQAATEYVYPVAVLDNESTILYIHQVSPQHIELFEWNPITNHAQQIVWSLYNPAGLQLLPNNVGFSFIDNGRLRIKLFQKRSPKTIDFDEPIFNINAIQWIDEHTCYCSAQRGDHFSLFQLHDNGTMHCLLQDNDNDLMYPRKIDSQLFYVERYKNNDSSNDFNYHIMQTTYCNPTNLEVIIDFYDRPIIFLHMISATEGFVIEHEKNSDSDAQTAHFLYHHVTKEGDTWYSKELFSFDVPTYLFLYNNEQRLFESILPLLPRVMNGKIYFVNCNDAHNLEPYYYDLLTKHIKKIAVAQDAKRHFFVPILCGNRLCCGGTKGENSILSIF